MSVTGFLLSAVGGYLVGLVGSSNQPLSGLTLSALVLSALVMLAIGAKGMSGVAAVLGVAGVVACACSVSGSLIQDLKAGHLLGGTPWKMQVVEILAVIVLSLFLMLPIIALHEANLATGGIGGRALPAPQAGLMAQLAKGIVGGQMAWGLIGIGAAFGIALILCGARAPMLIAVGMYLPFDTVSAIFVGGVIKWAADRMAARYGRGARAARGGNGHAAGLRADRRRGHHGHPAGGDVPLRHQLVHAAAHRRRRAAVLRRLGRLAVARRLRGGGLGADPHPAGAAPLRFRAARVSNRSRYRLNETPTEISVCFSRPLGASAVWNRSGLPVLYWRRSMRAPHGPVSRNFRPPP